MLISCLPLTVIFIIMLLLDKVHQRVYRKWGKGRGDNKGPWPDLDPNWRKSQLNGHYLNPRMSFRHFVTTPLAENMVYLLAKQNAWPLDSCFSSQSDGRSVCELIWSEEYQPNCMEMPLPFTLSWHDFGCCINMCALRSCVFAEAQHAFDVTFYA